MGRYSKAFSIKKQFQSPNFKGCQGKSLTLKKIVFLELLLRIIEDEKWNLFEKLGQLRTPTPDTGSFFLSVLIEDKHIGFIGFSGTYWWLV